MNSPFDDSESRALQYAIQRGLRLKESLGFGKDGVVFSTTVATAIKAFHRSGPFEIERECYQRLDYHGVNEILDHHIPKLVLADDNLLVLEISIVEPPYLLDFAGACLDHEPDFSQEVLDQWELDKVEEFGSNWPHARLILEILKNDYGIHLLDVHPGNIAFASEDEPPRAQ